MIVSPTPTPRLAAICWARGRPARPDELPELVGIGAPVVRRSPSTRPAPAARVDAIRPGGVPAVRAYSTEQCRAHAREIATAERTWAGLARAEPRPANPVARAPGRAPSWPRSTRQERPIAAISETAMAMPAAVAENARPPVKDQAGEPARDRHACSVRSGGGRRRCSSLIEPRGDSASCVATTSAAPVASAASSSTSTTCAAVAVSSWLVGSSASIRSGRSCHSAAQWRRAAPVRRRAPRAAFARGRRCRGAERLVRARRASFSDRPSSRSGSATFSTTESGSSRLAPWKIIAIGRRRGPVGMRTPATSRRRSSEGRGRP